MLRGLLAFGAPPAHYGGSWRREPPLGSDLGQASLEPGAPAPPEPPTAPRAPGALRQPRAGSRHGLGLRGQEGCLV